MKTKTLVLVSILLFSISSLTVSGQSQSFSGEWKFKREKSTGINNQLFMAKISVMQKSDSILTTRVYENENGEQYPFKENLPLNGKECKIVIYDMPRTSMASLSSGNGSLNVESTTTFYGNSGSDNLKTKETWNIQNGGKLLKIDYTTSYSGGSATGVQYFDKIK
jgi:hypothetical protein